MSENGTNRSTNSCEGGSVAPDSRTEEIATPGYASDDDFNLLLNDPQKFLKECKALVFHIARNGHVLKDNNEATQAFKNFLSCWTVTIATLRIQNGTSWSWIRAL